MITILRRNQRWLLFVVAIMTIIAFAWLYNRTDMEKLGANQVAQMYGKTIFQVDIDRVDGVEPLGGQGERDIAGEGGNGVAGRARVEGAGSIFGLGLGHADRRLALVGDIAVGQPQLLEIRVFLPKMET